MARGDLVTARILYGEWCAANPGAGCSMYISLVARGKGGRPSREEAERVLTPACEEGYTSACKIIGDYLPSFEGRKFDDLDALRWWRRGCDPPAGAEPDPLACFRAGNATVDEPVALELFSRACSGGYQPACTLKEKAESRQRLRSQCYPPPGSGIDAASCDALARDAEERPGAWASRVESAKRDEDLEQGCKGGDGCACYDAACRRALWFHPNEGRPLMTRGCELQCADACAWLARDAATPGPIFFPNQSRDSSYGAWFATVGTPLFHNASDTALLEPRAGIVVATGATDALPAEFELFYAGSYANAVGNGLGFRMLVSIFSWPRLDQSVVSWINVEAGWGIQGEWFPGFNWAHGPVIGNRLHVSCGIALTVEAAAPLGPSGRFPPSLEVGVIFGQFWGKRLVEAEDYDRCKRW